MKADYFKDFWNCIDFATLMLNAGYIICVVMSMAYNKLFLEDTNYRIIGSIVSFLLWIKVFYWMRLFNLPAFYNNLIM